MSLRGRYVIDRIKRVVSSYLKMPVPPYGNPLFWENVYKKMETASESRRDDPTFDDTFEWGGVGLPELLKYPYQPVTIGQAHGDYAKSSQVSEELRTTTWGKTIGVEPLGAEAPKKQPILMLGCGNSKMGEDMVAEGWRGPIVQLDIAQKALAMIERRSTQDRLEFVEDDACELRTIRNDSMHATIDKGLLDALFCADEYRQMTDILSSVLRVLTPGGHFLLFSRSRPEFLLPQLLPMTGPASAALIQPGKPTWQGLQMQQLSDQSMLLYRFQKSDRAGFREPRLNKKRKR